MTRQKIDGWKQLRLLNKVIDFKGQDAGIADRFNRPGHDSTEHPILHTGPGLKLISKTEPVRRFELRKCSNIRDFPVPAGPSSKELTAVIQTSCNILPPAFQGTFSSDYWGLPATRREALPLPPSLPRGTTEHTRPKLPFFTSFEGHFCMFVNGPHHHMEIVYTGQGKSKWAAEKLKKFFAALIKNVMIVTGRFGVNDASNVPEKGCDEVTSSFNAAEHKHTRERTGIELNNSAPFCGLVRHQYAHNSPAKAAAIDINSASHVPPLAYIRREAWMNRPATASVMTAGSSPRPMKELTTRDLLHSSLALDRQGNIYKLPSVIGQRTS